MHPGPATTLARVFHRHADRNRRRCAAGDPGTLCRPRPRGSVLTLQDPPRHVVATRRPDRSRQPRTPSIRPDTRCSLGECPPRHGRTPVGSAAADVRRRSLDRLRKRTDRHGGSGCDRRWNVTREQFPLAATRRGRRESLGGPAGRSQQCQCQSHQVKISGLVVWSLTTWPSGRNDPSGSWTRIRPAPSGPSVL